MQHNRSSDTQPEQTFRKALWQAGIRGYRKNVNGYPGKPDILFVKRRLAIFIHGCFWHGCPHCSRNLTPKTNAVFWATKIAQTKLRDERNRELLEEDGFRVLTIWECQLAASALPDIVEGVKQALALGSV